VKADRAFGPFIDQPADFVPVARLLFEQRENQNLGTAAFQLALKECRAHM
jgi:hypothetical protein